MTGSSAPQQLELLFAYAHAIAGQGFIDASRSESHVIAVRAETSLGSTGRSPFGGFRYRMPDLSWISVFRLYSGLHTIHSSTFLDPDQKFAIRCWSHDQIDDISSAGCMECALIAMRYTQHTLLGLLLAKESRG
jgi:hypothetical protein